MPGRPLLFICYKRKEAVAVGVGFPFPGKVVSQDDFPGIAFSVKMIFHHLFKIFFSGFNLFLLAGLSMS